MKNRARCAPRRSDNGTKNSQLIINITCKIANLLIGAEDRLRAHAGRALELLVKVEHLLWLVLLLLDTLGINFALLDFVFSMQSINFSEHERLDLLADVGIQSVEQVYTQLPLDIGNGCDAWIFPHHGLPIDFDKVACDDD